MIREIFSRGNLHWAKIWSRNRELSIGEMSVGGVSSGKVSWGTARLRNCRTIDTF